MARITAGVLCDFAQVREGLLFVLSGGLTRLIRPSVPCPMGVQLALMVEVPADEQDQAHEFVVVVKRNETADDIGRLVSGIQVQASDAFPGESIYLPAVVNMTNLNLPAYGAYDVRMSIDGDDGPHLTCYVVEARSDPR